MKRDINQYPKLLKAIINNCEYLSEGLLIVDALDKNMPIIDVNKEFMNITGYTIDEIIGKNPRILQGPETDKDSLDTIRQCLIDNNVVSTYVINYKKNGSTFWNRLTLNPIKDSNGKVYYWVWILRDISKLFEHVNRKTELNVMVTVLHTVSDIVHNYLNYLQLFRIELEEDAKLEINYLKEFDDYYLTFVKDIRNLNDLDTFREIILAKGIKILDSN